MRGSGAPSSSWLSAIVGGRSAPAAASAFRSSRTSGPTMTRAPAAFALSNAASTSSSPCAMTSGFVLGRVGGGEESRLHGLGRAAETSPRRAAARARWDRACADVGSGGRGCGGVGGSVGSTSGAVARRRAGFACRRRLRGGQCRQSERERKRTAARRRRRASARRGSLSPTRPGARSYERGRVSHGR